MVKLKGLYEWKLVNKDTGEIDSEGSQWNMTTDAILPFIYYGRWSSTFKFSPYELSRRVVLSSSVTSVGVDYRRSGRSNYFSVLASGQWCSGSGYYNEYNGSIWADHNFSPPGSPYTISIIGVQIPSEYRHSNFVSFIELSTPITQNTNQYLYVKYTLFSNFISNGNGTPNNRFTEYHMNACAFAQPYWQIATRNSGYNNQPQALLSLTGFLPADDINNVMRYCHTIYENINNYVGIEAEPGSMYGTTFQKSFSVSEITGPIGAIIAQSNSSSSSPYWFFQCATGFSPSDDIVPSVSRIFGHPSGREAYIFSDPTYPMTSQGIVSISGTPTNKYHIIGRIRITKTGDASDITDETIPYSNVDISSNIFTVAQETTTGDIYRVSSSGTLPSPLLADTNYYAINVSPTETKFATTYAFAMSGNAIDITTQGTGNHTLVRYNTGKYKLECEPWYFIRFRPIYQIPMGIDFDNNVMSAMLWNSSGNIKNYAEGDYVANQDIFGGVMYNMVRGAAKNGDYIYTVQTSRKGKINNICRWKFNTIETSQALCEFGTGATIITSVNYTSSYFYISTNGGLYRYDFSTPTVAPILLSITGIINNNITDFCIDPVTNYGWSGHSTGLCKIDLSALTATQYLNTTGGALRGLSNSEVNVRPSQLEAYNGRVTKGGATHEFKANDGYVTAWVLDDGIGWYRVQGTATNCCTLSIRKGTTNVYVIFPGSSRLYDVIVTGLGTGTSTQLEYYSIESTIDSSLGKAFQYDANTFITLVASYYSAYNYTFFIEHKIGVGVISSTNTMYDVDAVGTGMLQRSAIDIDGNKNYLMFHNIYLLGPEFPFPGSYGWNGSSWQRDFSGERYIPKTATHNLINGLSVDFSNNTGSPWDTQFVSGEHYNFVHGPSRVKDNLQTLLIRLRTNYTHNTIVENYNVTVPSSLPYNVWVPEISDPDFRDIDPSALNTFVYEGATKYSLATGTTYSVNTSNIYPATDIVRINANIPTGTPITIYAPYDTRLPSFLYLWEIYYVINISTIDIKLARTYADALSGTAINIEYIDAVDTVYLRTFPSLASGTYAAGSNGIFVFSSLDAGKNLTITYSYSKFVT